MSHAMDDTIKKDEAAPLGLLSAYRAWASSPPAAVTSRPMSEFSDDVAAALARLVGAPGAANPPQPAEPPTLAAAVDNWLATNGWKSGAHPSPGPRTFLALFLRHAEARGWSFSPGTRALNVELARHFRQRGTDKRGRLLVDKETADGLWLFARAEGLDTSKRPKPVSAPAHPAKRSLLRRLRGYKPRPFYPLHRFSRPVVDTLGRCYPTVREAARHMRVHPHSMKAAVDKGAPIGGACWRYMAPEEVELVPASELAGVCVASLRWVGTVSGQPLHGRARLLVQAAQARGVGDSPGGGVDSGGGPLSHISGEKRCPTCGHTVTSPDRSAGATLGYETPAEM